MTLRALAVDVLVGLGVGTELICCLALLVFRDVFDRLHYAMASTSVPPLLIAAAVLVEEGWNSSSINALAVAAFLLLLNPAAAVAIARAARLRRLGTVGATPEERAT